MAELRICDTCGLAHLEYRQPVSCEAAAIAALRAMVQRVGAQGTCKGCNATVYWIRHRETQVLTPYTAAGLNHFIDCPARDQFSKAKKTAQPSGNTLF